MQKTMLFSAIVVVLFGCSQNRKQPIKKLLSTGQRKPENYHPGNIGISDLLETQALLQSTHYNLTNPRCSDKIAELKLYAGYWKIRQNKITRHLTFFRNRCGLLKLFDKASQN